MRLLLDTHVLLWSQDDLARLTSSARSRIDDPSAELLVSAASVWELGIKASLGKLALSKPLREWVETALSCLDAYLLPIRIVHVERLRMLPFHHRDPFDRLLVSQALEEGVEFVSCDPVVDPYGVKRIW